jgi:hypothetical protein
MQTCTWKGNPDTGRSEDLAGGPLCAGGIFYEAVEEFVIKLTRLSPSVPKRRQLG